MACSRNAQRNTGGARAARCSLSAFTLRVPQLAEIEEAVGGWDADPPPNIFKPASARPALSPCKLGLGLPARTAKYRERSQPAASVSVLPRLCFLCAADSTAVLTIRSNRTGCAAEYRPESYPEEPDISHLPRMPTEDELVQPPPAGAARTCSKRRSRNEQEGVASSAS
jgi:hypothetical protein